VNTGAKTGDPSGPDHAFKPGFAFDAGIRSLKDLPIKGVIWYQGESNAQETERVQEYAALQELLVRDLRMNWNEPVLPFYYVQLSSIDSIKYRSQLWPQFRDEQRKFMAMIPHSGMAVSHDHGALNDVHPRNKKIIGERLSRWALKNDYG
jgi:sialate O-acetylesterase